MEKQLTPKLRFPEFKEDWKIESLENHIDLISGFAFKGEEITEDESGIPLLRGINITEGFIRHNKDIDRYFLGDLNSFSKYILKENDIVVGMDGSKVGKNISLISKKDTNSLLIQRVARIRSKKDLDIFFLYQNIFNSNFQNYVDKVNTSSGIPHISSKQINDFKIGFPKLEEQKKIASFLTSVDERITLLTQQKEKLELYKKGIMQQLFSQELRFKDGKGNDFQDWDEKSLGEIGSTLNGLTGKTKEHFGEGKPYIQYMQIFRASKIYTNEFGLVQINEGETQSKVQYGDVFFTTSSETPNEIGTSSVLLDKVDEVYLNSFCFGYRPNSLDELVPEFAQFLFRSKNVRDEIVKLAQGSTRFNMSKVAFMKQKISLPCKEEQQKIANFLTAIDNQIEQVANQIDRTTEFKKGLLQQMFV